MMMEHKSTGRCSMRTKFKLLGCLCIAFAIPAQATDQCFSDSVASALATAEGAWVDSLLAQGNVSVVPYDEQIFTEISPILDSAEGIKLPEDQLLVD
jgi:hypothetical protein